MFYCLNNLCNRQSGRKSVFIQKKAVISLLTLALLVMTLFTGCAKQSDLILGRWANEDGFIEFRRDGTFSTGKDSAKITISGASYNCGEGVAAFSSSVNGVSTPSFSYNLSFRGTDNPLGRFGFADSIFVFNISNDALTLTDKDDLSVTLKKVK